MPSAQLRQDPDSTQPADGGAVMGRLDVRKTLTAAALVAGLGGIVAVTEAGRDKVPELVPVAQVQQDGYVRLAALHARAETQELQYEPSKRDREGDDDDQDEPRH
jgi:hypothetical protein